MKKAKLLYGALAMLAFTACSDDNASRPDEVLNDGSDSFIKVRIVDAAALSGRDGDVEYDNGNDTESKITSLLVALYDSKGNLITTGNAIDMDFTTNQTPSGNNIETIAEAVVKFTLKPEQPTPSYAIAFANPIDPNVSLGNITSTKDLTRENWHNTSSNLFAMNNSAYFDINGKPVLEVSVSDENIFKDESKATLDNAKSVTFYLERIAGKVTLKSANAATPGIIPVETSELKFGEADIKFVPEKWVLNAVEKRTWLLKQFSDDAKTIQNNLQWKAGTNITTYNYANTLWNDPAHFRSYWCHSFSFNDPIANFPDVSDDLSTEGTDYPLEYYSYNYITSTNGADVGGSLYTLENTKRKSNYDKTSALVSALIVGHYEYANPASESDKELKTFYKRGNKLYTEEGFWTAMAAAQGYILKLKSSTESAVEYEGISISELKEIAKIAHPTTTNIGGSVIENYVSIQIDPDAYAANKLNDYYLNINGTPKKFSELTGDDAMYKDADDINRQLLSYCGLTEAYTDGKAYFNIPIEHLGTKSSEGTLSPGYYGIVRNHSYQITVDKIAKTAFGNGIFDLNKPIVPPTVNESYGLNAEVKVLAWRIVKKNITLQ